MLSSRLINFNLVATPAGMNHSWIWMLPLVYHNLHSNLIGFTIFVLRYKQLKPNSIWHLENVWELWTQMAWVWPIMKPWVSRIATSVGQNILRSCYNLIFNSNGDLLVSKSNSSDPKQSLSVPILSSFLKWCRRLCFAQSSWRMRGNTASRIKKKIFDISKQNVTRINWTKITFWRLLWFFFKVSFYCYLSSSNCCCHVF